MGLKNIFLYITVLFMLFTLTVSAEPSKVTALAYDDSSSIVFINTDGASAAENPVNKYVKLDNPNRIYFDINNAILIGQKQTLTFEKSKIKEIRLAQFSTNPDVVRAVLTFDEDFDTSKIKIVNINGNIIVKTEKPAFINNYFSTIYDENSEDFPYSGITANSQFLQKIPISSVQPANNITDKNTVAVMDDIYKAFATSTANNTGGNTIDSTVSIDLSSDLKLRTKYYINGYYIKNGGLLVSGLGQLTSSKIFTLDAPKRVVIDLPNAYVDKKIRNQVLNLCTNGTCSDTAKIGQFEYNKARIVITTENPDKYIPVYSPDMQSMLIINANKLNHTQLAENISNIQKAYTKKYNSKTSELIFSYTSPVVYSIVRYDNLLTIYMFNVKSYNEPDMIKTFNGTAFKNMTLSLLPQIGVKAEMKIKKDDIIQIAQGIDGNALRLTLTSAKDSKVTSPDTQSEQDVKPKRNPIKNKIVLDAGHGGTDYGAIREGINEKDITLDLTERVGSILKSKGYKPAYTRTDDTYLGLQERCDYTDAENPEIFVSIHVNSAVATEPYGIETHYYHEESKELAEVIQKHLMKEINTKDRGVLKSKFYVINHTEVPAVLVEIGFLSNPDERAKILTDKRKQATAKAIANGIIEYLKSQKNDKHNK